MFLRHIRTHQYGSIHQFLVLQLAGHEPWNKHDNHCSTKSWWSVNKKGTREHNQLITNYGPYITLIKYTYLLQQSPQVVFIYIYQLMYVYSYLKCNLLFCKIKKILISQASWIRLNKSAFSHTLLCSRILIHNWNLKFCFILWRDRFNVIVC